MQYLLPFFNLIVSFPKGSYLDRGPGHHAESRHESLHVTGEQCVGKCRGKNIFVFALLKSLLKLLLLVK